MPKKPTIHKRTTLTNTGIFNIEQMDLEFSNGATRQYQRIVGSDQGAVLVVPMLDPETLLLIREYAAGMHRYELCFPKGHIEAGEGRVEAANREIQEEIGYAARDLQAITSVTVAPGYLYHTTHIVLARDLYPQRLPGDEPEPIETLPWKLSEFDQLLAQEEFTEARSIAALYIIRDWLANN
ncbi:MAG: ADP compounds hydrolase NudE [Sedimenticola sp.]|jgi:ADP-ribose diphosphatase|nr:MAG: ADP compounds hydrolase NudE [Sedimenticola sp.]